MHPQPLYHAEGGPVPYASPNGAVGNEVSRMNLTSYGYPHCNGTNQSIQIPYDPHGPRDARLQDDTNFLEGPNEGFPPGFSLAPIPHNPYLGTPMAHPTSHLGHHGPNHTSIPRSHSSGSAEQSAKSVLTEADINIYAAFLHFRHCLQKYLHAHADSSASVKLFWRDIDNTVESSSKAAGEFYNK
ncbi:hypothetical protein M422DRAFT_251903 [Sphaerobolus stellatus SS14]|uniref:Uncharacterized protein n=1 Tax=Sphaerobolus stellatus (strain SS14) TaxID=990650 RepID=A0A0C9W109_SPHS4|nr:hypothetical protein M422DRAFT_251903 [Sphaerobolus stellatus SS14]